MLVNVTPPKTTMMHKVSRILPGNQIQNFPSPKMFIFPEIMVLQGLISTIINHNQPRLNTIETKLFPSSEPYEPALGKGVYHKQTKNQATFQCPQFHMTYWPWLLLADVARSSCPTDGAFQACNRHRVDWEQGTGDSFTNELLGSD